MNKIKRLKRQATAYDKAKVERLVAENQKIMEETGGYTDECTSFSFHQTVITNPFYDETERFPVDPAEYYGEDFLNSDFVK